MNQVVPDNDTRCQKCGAGSETLCFGGVGDWRNKVMCERCHHVWHMHPRQIQALAAQQLGVPEPALAEVDARSQAEFEQVVLGGPNFPDLPEALPVARWLARRLALVRR